jgi:hypothetical protein
MPFVRRDAAGRVISLHREQETQELQYLPLDHPDVVGFLEPIGERRSQGRGELHKSDLEMIRVYEDLAEILIGKRIVALTDFPQAAQEKLMRRRRLRSSLSPITDALGGGTSDDEGLLP